MQTAQGVDEETDEWGQTAEESQCAILLKEKIVYKLFEINRSGCIDNKNWNADGTPHSSPYTDTHIQRQTSWDGRSSEAPVTVRESVCWRGPPDAPSGPCQFSLAHWSSPGRDLEERPWMEKAGTTRNMGQGQSIVQAGQHRYCTVSCCVVCVWRGKSSCERSHSQIKVLCLGCLPTSISCLLSLRCPFRLVLPCLLRPLIMSSLARSFSFILSCAGSLTSGGARKRQRREREAAAGREAFQVLLRPTLTLQAY